MREILFRGQRTHSGEWIEGCYVRHVVRNCPFAYITLSNTAELIRIYTDTLGQYTGLTDKNGKKIFEGDIVKTSKFNTPFSLSINKKYIIKFDLQFGAFIGQDKYDMYFTTFDGDSDEFEVIGNIHDNPELLKGEQG